MGTIGNKTIGVSISAKLMILLTAIILATVAIVGMIAVRSAEAALKDRILEDVLAISIARERQITSLVEQDFDRVALIASRTRLRASLAEIENAGLKRPQLIDDMNRILADAVHSVASLQEISVTDASGRVVASTNSDLIGKDIADSQLFLKGKERFYLSGQSAGEELRYYVSAPMSHPEESGFLGTVIVRIEPLVLKEILTDYTGLGKTGELVLGTQRGNQVELIGPLRHESQIGQRSPIAFDSKMFEPLLLAAAGKEGITLASDYRGVEVLAAYRHISTGKWGLVAKIDSREAFQPIVSLRNQVTWLGLLLLMLGTLFAYLSSKVITRRIQMLRSGVSRIAAGQLDYRVEVKGQDELRELCTAFNQMAAQLEEDINQRRRTENHIRHLQNVLEAIRDVNQLIVHEKNQQKLLEEACEILNRSRDYNFVWIGLFLQKTQEILPAACAGSERCELSPLRLHLNEPEMSHSPVAAVIKTKEPLVIRDFRDDPLHTFGKETIPELDNASAAIVPLLHEDSVLGVLSVYSVLPGAFDDEELSLLMEVARDIAFALRAIKMEEDTLITKEYLQSIIDNTSDMVCTVGLDGKFLTINHAVTEQLGYDEQDLIGFPKLKLAVEPEKFEATFRQVLETGRVQTLELPFKRKDGSVADILYSVSLLRDKEGRPKAVAGFGKDISELKQAEKVLRTRAHQQAAVARLGQEALAGIELAELMERTVSVVAEILQVEYCKVLELLPDEQKLLLRCGVGWKAGLVGHAKVDAGPHSQAGYTLQSSEPVIVEDLQCEIRFTGPPLLNEHGVVSGMSVIIEGRQRPFGVLGAHTTRRRTFTEDDVIFLQAAANVLAQAIERKRAEEALEKARKRLHILSHQLLQIQENERRHLARELHDEIGQALTAVKIALRSAQGESPPALPSPQLQECVRVVDHALERVRHLSLDLRPSMLDDLGLVPALRWYIDRQARQTGLSAEFTARLPQKRFRPQLEITCYRVVQEGLTNVAKHAGNPKVWIELYQTNGEVHLRIRDQGVGFDVNAARERAMRGGSLGLLGMEERVVLAGGQFEIRSAPGVGSEIEARFPIEQSEAALSINEMEF